VNLGYLYLKISSLQHWRRGRDLVFDALDRLDFDMFRLDFGLKIPERVGAGSCLVKSVSCRRGPSSSRPLKRERK